MSAEWERLLDAFAAAAEADEPAPAWAEPADPLPPELEARAREVLAKTRARIVRGRRNSTRSPNAWPSSRTDSARRRRRSTSM